MPQQPLNLWHFVVTFSKLMRALICMQSWLKGDDIITDFEDEPCHEELEFYEDIEEELRNTMRQVPLEENYEHIHVVEEGDDVGNFGTHQPGFTGRHFCFMYKHSLEDTFVLCISMLDPF
ncbi:unnamed protein product [Cuscuta campestris]|uniref:Uncharacterized protein n=1 Tax=Cuscuta campestris TaxID=132261 RepID=A0A484N630_9ASTE|nr:unnamed protein product [Cuscuta campestris]